MREKITAVLFMLGVLLELGAMGNGDFYGYLSAGDFARIGIGAALNMAGFITVRSCAEKDGDDQEQKRYPFFPQKKNRR